MANISPTKSNLMQSRKSLTLANLGYELLDRKRNIMMREMMSLIDRVSELQGRIDTTFAEAYDALKHANMTIGMNSVSRIAGGTEIADDVTVLYRSVMGIELPTVRLDRKPQEAMTYGFHNTNMIMDDTYVKFRKVKELAAEAAEVENSVYRLAYAIKQAKKRANALSNIIIPRLESDIRYITGYLEEKEREEFTAQKVIKNMKSEEEL